MTITKRRILIGLFILLFLVLAPAIVFYANGNILGTGWSILATGGIFVRSMESGANIFINGKLKDTTGFFTRDYLVKNLKPGIYSVSVEKDGYNSWSNSLKVQANRVTESRVFMLPKDIITTEISEYLEINKDISSTSKKVSYQKNPNYPIIKNLFSNLSSFGEYLSVVSTTTGSVVRYAPGIEKNPITNRKVSVWRDGKDAFIGWTGTTDSSPKIFCEEIENNLICQKYLKIYSFESEIRSIDFFPGESEIIVVAVADKIYAIEAEENPNKKPQVIYSGKNPDFRNYNNILYIKDGNFLGQVKI